MHEYIRRKIECIGYIYFLIILKEKKLGGIGYLLFDYIRRKNECIVYIYFLIILEEKMNVLYIFTF